MKTYRIPASRATDPLGRVSFLARVLLCAALLLTQGSQPSGAESVVKSEDVAVNAITNLAVDLYKELSSEQENLCFSPYSVSSAFAMTYAGARGETADEMRKALHLEDGIHESNQALLKGMQGAPETAGELGIANSIWPMRGYRFLAAYRNLLDKNYEVEVTPLDFKRQPERSRRKINEWVEAKTMDRIQDILPFRSVGADTKLVLVNALYFKAPWLEAFKETNTTDADFFTTASDKKTVRMMNAASLVPYGEVEGVQVVKLPYRQGLYAMVLLLPKEKNALTALEERLTPDLLDEFLAKVERRKVNVFLPRFRVERTFDVVGAMQSLGVRSAFDPLTADFSGMNGKRDLFISTAVHKAFVEVDEQGTEAAAATAIAISRLSAGLFDSEPAVFRADHPFIFMIRDEISGAILFMGKVVRP